jgi:hypothetical protein
VGASVYMPFLQPLLTQPGDGPAREDMEQGIMCIHTYIHAYMHAYMHAYIHTCVYTYIHTHIHTYILTYIRMGRTS